MYVNKIFVPQDRWQYGHLYERFEEVMPNDLDYKITLQISERSGAKKADVAVYHIYCYLNGKLMYMDETKDGKIGLTTAPEVKSRLIKRRIKKGKNEFSL